MNKNMITLRWSLLAVLLLLSGCSAMSGWDTESAPEQFTDGTRIIGEVILIADRSEVMRGDGLMRGWYDKLMAAGYSDSDIVDGSEVTVWTYCFGWNSGVDLCTHHGHYVVHVPPELIAELQLQSDEETGTSGDLLEVELQRNPQGYLIGSPVAVYRRSEDWGACREARLQQTSETYGALLTLSGVGPPRALWIECDGVESDGWLRQPVPGAPISEGPPISQWVKLP